jgi:hypothetical protein
LKVLPLPRDADVPPALLDDAEDGGKAQTGAFADALRGEERLENTLARRPRHAGARVRNRQHHVRSGRDAGVQRCIGCVELHVGYLDAELTSVGHGVSCIHRQVHDDLLELGGVGLDSAHTVYRKQRQRDIGSEQTLQQAFHLQNELAEVEHLRLQQLPATEGQQLPHEVRGAITGASHFLDVLTQRVVGRQLFRNTDGIAQHYRQQVVEVVRDAGGELADRLQLLGLAQLRLQLSALGDIRLDTHELQQLAIFSKHG